MDKTTLTLGHSPDPDDAFMFYALAKDLIPTHGFHFTHILQDIQTLNERATRGELDISAVSIHAYAYVSDKYALLPSGASMGDGYGPMLVAKQKFSREEILKKRIAVPGTMTSAFLALQLWLSEARNSECGTRSGEAVIPHPALPTPHFDYVVVPFDQIFSAVKNGTAEIGLIIHEGQLTYQNEGLVVCEDLGVWWGRQNDGLPLPLGGNVIHKKFAPDVRKKISDTLTASIQFSLDHRAEAVQHALQYARDMGRDLADKFVGMYVNHWTLDYGEKGRESIRRFLRRGFERGLIPQQPELEFVPVDPVDTMHATGEVKGSGAWTAVLHNGSNSLPTLRYHLKDLTYDAVTQPYKVGDVELPAGSLLLPSSARVKGEIEKMGFKSVALTDVSKVEKRPAKLPRLAMYTTWGNTQDVGWVRYAFDHFELAYDLIYKERVRKGSLRDSYDVIVIPSQGRTSKSLVFDIESKAKPLAYTKTRS